MFLTNFKLICFQAVALNAFWLLVVLFSFFSTSLLYAQQIDWDSTRRPAIYDTRVQFYKGFIKSKKDIVFLGNSITFWGEWSGLLKNKHIKNFGIPGDNTFGVLERLEDIIQGQPRKIFIMIGINDLGAGIPDSVIITNCHKMMRRIRKGSPRTSVYFQSMLPTNAAYGKLNHLYHKNDRIQSINQQLENIAQSEGVTWVDLFSHFVDERGNLNASYSYDGIHLVYKGYDVWAAILSKYRYL